MSPPRRCEGLAPQWLQSAGSRGEFGSRAWSSPGGTPSAGQAPRVLSPLARGPETPGKGQARGKAPVALAESRLSPLAAPPRSSEAGLVRKSKQAPDAALWTFCNSPGALSAAALGGRPRINRARAPAPHSSRGCECGAGAGAELLPVGAGP